MRFIVQKHLIFATELIGIMTKKSVSIFLFIILALVGYGQDDPVLFTVDDSEVRLSEFEYIYSKNNGENADYSKKSLKEYLDLYVKFKLKVAEARSKKIDTLPSYVEELAGYRRQLADSYIVEKELARRIAKEAYERLQKDVTFSHILINLPPKAPAARVAAAQEKIDEAMAELKKGKSFESVAKEYSEDKKTNTRGGKVGYMTAILPDGYYDLESALYDTPKGKYSDIFRSNLGLHIVRVDDIRPARGRMSVAHILIRKKYKGVDNPEAKKEIEEIYKSIKKGESFENLAAQRSQDNNTKLKKGVLGEFGIGKYEKPFEDAAFALKKDGDISKPIESSIGFHIIKRLSRQKLGRLEEIQNDLIKKTNRGDRQEAGKVKLKKEVQKEAGYVCYDDVLDKFISGLDETFYQYSWVLPELSDEVLCVLGDEKYTVAEFAKYCKRQGRKRMQYNDDMPRSQAVKELYQDYTSEKSVDYQQDRLEEKYSDFRNLMREYEEGILLFEVTKNEVWDKASQDDDAIEAFYNANKENYKWEERAEVIEYSLRSTDAGQITKILKKAGKSKPEEVAKAFNKDKEALEVVMYADKVYEKDDEAIQKLQWREGAVSPPNINYALKMATFRKIEKILPQSPKSLEDARGFVISDYQVELEKEWIETLKTKYAVNMNNDVLNQLIK